MSMKVSVASPKWSEKKNSFNRSNDELSKKNVKIRFVNISSSYSATVPSVNSAPNSYNEDFFSHHFIESADALLVSWVTCVVSGKKLVRHKDLKAAQNLHKCYDHACSPGLALTWLTILNLAALPLLNKRPTIHQVPNAAYTKVTHLDQAGCETTGGNAHLCLTNIIATRY